MLLLIDNYDSFTYNLYQYLAELGADVVVRRNDAITVTEAEALTPSHLVISPGPCTPHEAGVSNALIAALGPRIPTLGVCLGHQCIGEVFGGRVIRAPEPVHGKTTKIHHTGAAALYGLPDPFEATRYHSLIVERASLPASLEIIAETDDGLIMGLRHREYPITGVQFHPESIMTGAGKDLLRNFLDLTPSPVGEGEPESAKTRKTREITGLASRELQRKVV
ncbi:MAG TPA: aminodeoxychorismate/anthranilate synthase component II [Ktedonobacterales bacterium]|nr:aminodeoxychorismate/anthranilate synthase component II [Ktedonobacterales bacterium]